MSNVLVLIFPSRNVLADAIDRLDSINYVDIKNTALITKADDGETIVLEDDITPVEGAITGGTLGSLMSALGVAQLGAFLLPGVGPIIAIGAGALIGALVGGTTGGVAARLLDFGFNNDQLDTLARRLQAGSIALVVEIDDRDKLLPRLQQDLNDLQAETMLPPGE